MKLYFQFFTFDQTVKSLGLIQIPALLVSDDTVRARAKVSGGGLLWPTKRIPMAELREEIAESHFNEMEVTYAVKQWQIQKEKVTINHLNGVFAPAASSRLWFPSENFVRGDRSSMMRRANARRQEQSLVTNGLSEKPAVFEVVLDLKTRSSENQILDFVAERLAQALGRLDMGLKVFGCCDIVTKDAFVGLEAHALVLLLGIRVMSRLLPKDYPEMNRKVDDVHRIIVSATDVCEGLAAALGKQAALIPAAKPADASVIRIDFSDDIASARTKIKKWLLPTIR